MLRSGRERVATLSPEVARVLQGQFRGFSNQLRALGSTNRAFQEFVASGGTKARDSALALLKVITDARGGDNLRVTLFALDGTPIATSPPMAAGAGLERHGELADAFRTAAEHPDSLNVGALRRIGGRIGMPFVVRVTARDSSAVGYLTLWRGLRQGATADQLSALIGTDARVYWGNSRGDLWVDLAGKEKVFPTTLPINGEVIQYQRDSVTPVLTAARSIAGTPWAVAVSMPDSAIMAPADTFLSNSIFLGSILVVLSTLAAWGMSRRITTPLSELTAATTAVAAGDHTQTVRSDRTDEIGQLAESFNRMVANVDAAHQTLEGKVRVRTLELQERNEELEAFAHSVSHDLRAPLRAMHGFSQALLEDCKDQLSADGLQYVTRIAAAAHRMDLLTQDLLAYSRVSRTEMPLSAVELGPVVSSAVSQLEADVHARSAHVAVAELPRALAHRPVLEQVIANLVSNGLKFVPKDRKPELRISAEQGNGRVRISVVDNGIGIDPQHHHRIFSVFERLHANDQYPGTGIGLAIVRKGVERMGGHVGVESTLGEGSRFWIELKSAEAVT